MTTDNVWVAVWEPAEAPSTVIAVTATLDLAQSAARAYQDPGEAALEWVPNHHGNGWTTYVQADGGCYRAWKFPVQTVPLADRAEKKTA